MKLQTLQALILIQKEHWKDHGRLFEVHISKHSPFSSQDRGRLSASTYPSIHVETPSRSKSVVWCVGCVCTWVLCMCVCCCVVVVRVGCVVKLGTLSLSCSLSLLPLLFPFIFLSSFSFSLAPSLTALVLSLSLLPSFFPSTHSSLLFPSTPTNTVQSTDQQTRRPTLNVMWRTVRSQQLPTKCTECSHLSSSLLLSHSLLPPSHTQKKKRSLFITGIFPAMNLFFTVLNQIKKSPPVKITVITYILIRKQ